MMQIQNFRIKGHKWHSGLRLIKSQSMEIDNIDNLVSPSYTTNKYVFSQDMEK